MCHCRFQGALKLFWWLVVDQRPTKPLYAGVSFILAVTIILYIQEQICIILTLSHSFFDYLGVGGQGVQGFQYKLPA